MAAWFPYDVHVLIASLVYLAWYYFKDVYSKFKKNNIPYLKPFMPFGNMTKSTLLIQPIAADVSDAYNKFPDYRYIGFFQYDKPIIIIRDPDMIKKIMVKDFDYFVNHQPFVNEDIDPLFGKNLFSLNDNKWRNMRSTLSPAFTGSKMKNMCTFVSDCGRQVCNYLEGEMANSDKVHGKKSLTIELKDLCTRFASDVIATTVFGVKVDSLNDKDNQFYTVGRKASNFDGIALMKFFGYMAFPKMFSVLKIRLFNEEHCQFYRNLVQDTMKYREKENISRPDMIHLLMEAKKGTLKYEEQANGGKAGFATVEEADVNITSNNTKWSDDDLTAQALLFFLAGFDTAANLMCFILYELALNGDIQERLQHEIDASIDQNGEFLTYDVLQKLTYLDMVVSETLRKWPPSITTDRLCSKEYDLGPCKDGLENNVKMKQEELLWIPIYAIHRDSTYWPNPEKFDPERFSEENKNNIRPYTYLPFGAGPRNCIGSRYALMEAKVMVYYLVSKYNLEVNSRMPQPIKLSTTSFNLIAKGGFWLNFTPRDAQKDSSNN